MSAFSNLVLALLKRIHAVLSPRDSSTSTPVPRDLSLPSTQRADTEAVLAAYALGWREGLETAAKISTSTRPAGECFPDKLRREALTPWPDHPEYGWRPDDSPHTFPSASASDGTDPWACATCQGEGTATEDVAQAGDQTLTETYFCPDCGAVGSDLILDAKAFPWVSELFSRLDCAGEDNQAKASIESWTGASDIIDGYPV